MTMEKMLERSAEHFKRLDTNGDGAIDAADFKARSDERAAWETKRRMHVLDKDSDGKVTVEEFTARARQRFGDLDLDRNGKLGSEDMPPWRKGGKGSRE